jgi:hypothetical protein
MCPPLHGAFCRPCLALRAGLDTRAFYGTKTIQQNQKGTFSFIRCLHKPLHIARGRQMGDFQETFIFETQADYVSTNIQR